MPNITIHCKTVYGQMAFYPACATSKELIKLTGKKTFSKADLDVARALGYGVDYFADIPKNEKPLAEIAKAAIEPAP